MAKHYILYDTEEQVQTIVNPADTVPVDNIIINKHLYVSGLFGSMTLSSSYQTLDSFSTEYNHANYEIGFKDFGTCRIDVSHDSTSAHIGHIHSNVNDPGFSEISWRAEIVGDTVRVQVLHLSWTTTLHYNISRTLFCNSEIK